MSAHDAGQLSGRHSKFEADEDPARPVAADAPIPVVGLGGSAGAISSLTAFFRRVPDAPGIAIVVVLHLPADHQSTLAALLQRTTRMPVMQVQGPVRIERDRVYVIPPGKSLEVVDGHLRLGELKPPAGRHVAVDLFFRTLADTHGANAAAVVLSGADGDGASGLKRIKERGGLTIVQLPDEAEHDGMPRAALATGMVDWVLPAEDMPARLLQYFHVALEPSPVTAAQAMPSREQIPPTQEAGQAQEVLSVLRTRTGLDLSHFKPDTVLRRVARRMQVNGVEPLGAYLDRLRGSPAESAALLQDLLVSVSNFFRDPPSFAALEHHIPAMFAGKSASDMVRVWVAGCATGEEAYSIAMLLADHARGLDAAPAVQVFATDVDEQAIRSAREGLYPASIEADVSGERLQRFFLREHRGYRVRRELRETVLFATHDVLKDSPYSRLDLVSCRNMLIHLHGQAKARVIDIFHFALRPGGKLLLGASESIDDDERFFGGVDREHGIYMPRAIQRLGLPVPAGASTLAHALEVQRLTPLALPAPQRASSEPRTARRGAWSEMHLRLMERWGPPSLLVDSAFEIVHLTASAGHFLQYGGGEPTRHLLRSANPALRTELRAALYEARRTGTSAVVPDVPFALGDEALLVTVRVTPASEPGAEMFLVTFQSRAAQEGQPAVQQEPSDTVARHLEQELLRLRTHLRNTVEQYESSAEDLKTSNEELQSLNEELRSATEEMETGREELQSLNEELRSATEEMETGREELQSINEELTTVNQELKSRVDELAHANSDMHNLMNATAIATVFLDRDLCITRYTPSAVSLFNLIPTDVGRPLSHLTGQLRYGELGSDARRVLDRLAPVEREVGHDDGSWFLARLLPYRTLDDRIGGVVLSFIDITERKRGEELRLWLSAVVRFSSDAIMSFGLDGTILSWNSGAESIFGYQSTETIGQPLSMLSPASSGEGKEIVDLLDRIATGQPVRNFETVGRRKDGSTVPVSLSVSPIHDEAGKVMAGTATARDITTAKEGEAALRESREQLRLVIENADEFAIFSTDLERRVTTWNTGAQRILGYTGREVLGHTVDIIFTDEDRAAGAPEIEAATALSDGRASDDRFHVRKDGTRFWASGAMMLMRDAAGEAIGFVKILRDQTQFRKAQDAAERNKAELMEALQDNLSARRALEAADAAKDRFLAVLSHELRTPLASIAAAALLLDAPVANADRRKAAEVVRRQSDAMSELLSDLLDISRLRLGRLALQRQVVRISSVVEAALEMARPLVEASRHNLTVSISASEPEVDADPGRIAQVVSNLVCNAAKYTPPGGHIGVSAQVEDDQVVVTVADDGIGMVPEDIEAMFDMFTQAPQVRDTMNGGLGIGLALSRSIVELHGGWIQAHSAGPGRGSRFRFGLPLHGMALRPAGKPGPRARSALATKPAPAPGATTILIADDSPDAAWGIARLLELAGYHALIAHGGKEAIELAHAHHPTVVLLDIGMPDLDGHEVARRLRADPPHPSMMLVATTGWGQQRDVHEALAAGFDVHLTKPVDVAVLRKLIDDHLAPRRQASAAAR